MSLTQAVKLWDNVAPAWPLWCHSLKEHALSPGWSPPELQAGNLLWHSPPLWTAGKHLLHHGLSHSFQGASAPTCSPSSTPVPLALELFLTETALSQSAPHTNLWCFALFQGCFPILPELGTGQPWALHSEAAWQPWNTVAIAQSHHRPQCQKHGPHWEKLKVDWCDGKCYRFLPWQKPQSEPVLLTPVCAGRMHWEGKILMADFFMKCNSSKVK